MFECLRYHRRMLHPHIVKTHIIDTNIVMECFAKMFNGQLGSQNHDLECCACTICVALKPPFAVGISMRCRALPQGSIT